MRNSIKKISVVIFIFFLINKSFGQTIASWATDLETQLEQYDKKAKLKKQTTSTINGVTVKTLWYRKKKKINKITQQYSYYKHPLEVTYYFKRKKIVLQRKLGAAQKIKTQPHHNLHDVYVYVKNTDTLVQKSRIAKMVNSKAYYSAYTKMLMLPYAITNYSPKESKETFKKIIETVNTIKKK